MHQAGLPARSVDEYSGGGGAENADEFEISAVFTSMGSFIGIFLGSFILGCAMGLLTALVSSTLIYLINPFNLNPFTAEKPRTVSRIREIQA